MPGRAFIPGPLAQAQPRVYRALRGRQFKGLFLSGAGAALGLLIFGAKDVAGYGATFLMAVPGFAYGYFQPEGKPVEYWALVLLRYHFSQQRFGAAPAAARQNPARLWFAALRRSRKMRITEEVLAKRGRR